MPVVFSIVDEMSPTTRKWTAYGQRLCMKVDYGIVANYMPDLAPLVCISSRYSWNVSGQALCFKFMIAADLGSHP